MEAGLSQTLALLSSQASRVMDRIEQIGGSIPHGTPLGEATLSLMDIVIEMDAAITNAQRAVAFCGSAALRGRRTTREEQQELLQSRRDRRSWEQKRQEMEKKMSDNELKIKNLQELNTMLMDRARATTPSSGFCSAPHSPGSMEEDAATPPGKNATAVEKKEEVEVPIVFPPPKPGRRPMTQHLDYTPGIETADFKDSIQIHSKKIPFPIEDMDDTISLSDSPEAPNEGPLCSTFREERSVYHTPVTSKKNTRRRSSSLSDVMKKIFTPKQARKVKNPILELMDE